MQCSSDKQFPVLGFGAKLPGHSDVSTHTACWFFTSLDLHPIFFSLPPPPPPTAQASHEFALNGNPQNPYCFGGRACSACVLGCMAFLSDVVSVMPCLQVGIKEAGRTTPAIMSPHM